MLLRLIIACVVLSLSGTRDLSAAEETREVVAQDLKLQVPKTWKQQQVTSNLRLAQFAIEPVEGDEDVTEMVVFPPFGGSVAENVKRWIAQFEPEGRAVTMTQGEAEQGKYVLVDLTGTYNKPDGPPILRKTKPTPGYRMVAVMFTAKAGGNYFLKLTGPEKTVAAAIDAFRQSFGGDASKEEKYEL